MPDVLPNDFHGSRVALVTALLVLAIVVMLGIWLARVARRGWRTFSVAQQLIDLHAAQLDAVSARGAEHAAQRSQRSQRLQRSTGSLADALRALHFLVTALPEERARLERTLLDMALPTDHDGKSSRARARET